MGISYEVIGCPKKKHDGYEEDASYCPDCEIELILGEVERLRALIEEAATTMESTGEPYNFWSKRAEELRRRAK